MSRLSNITAVSVLLGLAAAGCTQPQDQDQGAASDRASKLDTLTLDWAYYNPVSILMKDRGWLEEALKPHGVKVRWVLSLGSNKALEYLRGGSADFASTAGAASVIGRAAGVPIRVIYVYSKPEWTALVTRKDTQITSVKALAGKKVAVTRGTDPHIFLLRALDAAGLSEDDIQAVLLQHPDGYRALVGQQVDAWAGLDPHMAKAELESGAILFHRAPDLNTYGVLNVREAFLKTHPELVQVVLQTYEKARIYALEHPDDLVKGLVAAAKVDRSVAKLQLGERTDLSQPRPGAKLRETLLGAGQVLQKIGVVEASVSIEATLDALIDPKPLDSLEKTKG